MGTDSFDASALVSRFEAVCERLEKAMSRAEGRRVQLVAVSKKHPPEAVAALAAYWEDRGATAFGSPVFGENYVQEALEKQDAVQSMMPDKATAWHFIGHIQSRKAKDVAGKFALIQTVDSEKLASQLQKAVAALQEHDPSIPAQPVLLQVNIGREEQKGGVMPDALEELAQAVLRMPQLTVGGLMCLPPFDENPEVSRPYFQEMRALRDRLEKNLGLPFPELSMGMSHDFEVAVQEGATMVRVGTDIFGPRQY